MCPKLKSDPQKKFHRLKKNSIEINLENEKFLQEWKHIRPTAYEIPCRVKTLFLKNFNQKYDIYRIKKNFLK